AVATFRGKKLVSDFFNGKEPNKSINSDEAVTYGAASHLFFVLACAQCEYPSAKIRSFEWGLKVKCRKTTGSGRTRYLKGVSPSLQEWLEVCSRCPPLILLFDSSFSCLLQPGKRLRCKEEAGGGRPSCRPQW
ncbi:hypothetical protein DFH11DRAFT_1859396, partial [Phellopilus nigrolimitatus]